MTAFDGADDFLKHWAEENLHYTVAGFSQRLSFLVH